jgi:high mobility group protein B2
MSKKKKTRDPLRPKRAMTPFLYYACEQRALLKEQGRKMSLTEQSRFIADRWKVVADKTLYEQRSEKDRTRYRAEMSTYTPPYKIKRPRSSYAFFMRDMRSDIARQHPDKTPRELMSNVAAAWKTIDKKTKDKYITMAEEDKTRYMEEKKVNTPT